MRLNTQKARLAALTKELNNQWHETAGGWRDAKRREFEAHYITPLMGGVESALTVMEELDRVLTKIIKDCEEEH